MLSVTILDNFVNNLLEKLQAWYEKQETVSGLKQLPSVFVLPDPGIARELPECLCVSEQQIWC